MTILPLLLCSSRPLLRPLSKPARRAPVAPDLEKIVGQAYQPPLATHLGQAAQQEAAEATHSFDLAKHRFDNHLSPRVQGPARGRAQLRRHFLFGRTFRRWPARSALLSRSMMSLPAGGHVR